MNYDNDEIRKKEEEKERELAELIALGVLLFSDEEDEILRAIAAYLTVDDFNGDLNKWRSAHLAQANNVDRTVREIISGYSQVQNEVVSAVINTAAVNAVNRVDAPLASAGVSAAGGAKNTASKAARYFINQAKHDINTCNTVMRYKAKHGFVTAVNAAFFNAKQSERIWKALGEGALSVAEGRESLQSAVRKTIMQVAKDGIPAFIDKAGREWSPEAYVRMDLRTTAANTAREATFERCAENDINLIEVDAHSGARPLCAPWQGRIYSLDGTSGTVKDGSGRQFDYIPLTSTSYGKAAGLFGINCGHRPYPFRPGVNFKTWQPLSSEEDFEKNSRLYKQFQKQRALERRIRADKRDCMMCEAAGDKKGFTENAKLLKRSRGRYRAYCKATGLKEHNDRTQVYGFDRSVSAKAVWADRKARIHNVKANDLVFNKISGQKEIEKSLKAEFNNEYSNFAKTFGELSTIKGVEAQTYTGNGVFGTYNDNSGVLTLYGVGGKDGKSFMQKTASQHYKDGDWSTKNYMHSFRHELGHAWQKQLSKADPNYPAKLKKIQKMKDDFWSGLTSSQEYATMNLRKEQGKVLSVYGLGEDYDIDELISESVAEYLNGKPRSFAKNVIDILLEKE